MKENKSGVQLGPFNDLQGKGEGATGPCFLVCLGWYDRHAYIDC